MIRMLLSSEKALSIKSPKISRLKYQFPKLLSLSHTHTQRILQDRSQGISASTRVGLNVRGPGFQFCSGLTVIPLSCYLTSLSINFFIGNMWIIAILLSTLFQTLNEVKWAVARTFKILLGH